MLKSLVIGVGLLAAMQGTAAGGELQDKAAQAETALAAGDGSAAIRLMREALAQAWADMPLTLSNAMFVTAPADGYGIYSARGDNVFAVGETLRVYLEPTGFEWREDKDLFTSLLTVDFDLSLPDGRVVAGQKKFGRFEYKSHVPNTECMANLTVNLSGAPAGDYVLDLTVNDEYGGGSARVQMPFSLK